MYAPAELWSSQNLAWLVSCIDVFHTIRPDIFSFTGGKRVVGSIYNNLRNKGSSGTYVVSASTVVVK